MGVDVDRDDLIGDLCGQDRIGTGPGSHVQDPIARLDLPLHRSAEQVRRGCRREHVLGNVQIQPEVLDVVSTEVVQLTRRLLVPLPETLHPQGRQLRPVLVHRASVEPAQMVNERIWEGCECRSRLQLRKFLGLFMPGKIVFDEHFVCFGERFANPLSTLWIILYEVR